MIYFILLLMAVMGYLFGSLNFAVIIGKLFYKTDVRQHGSGNAGATNVQRTLGSKAAAFVALGDLLLTLSPIWWAVYLNSRFCLLVSADLLRLSGITIPSTFTLRAERGF